MMKSPIKPWIRALALASVAVVLTIGLFLQAETSAQQVTRPQLVAASQRAVVDRYCVTCHNERVKTANLMLDRVDISHPADNSEVWEHVLRKVRTGTMPPPTVPQLPDSDRKALMAWLETSLDAAFEAKPNPGRTDTLRRLNRTEYRNAIRDLLAIDIDANSLLPADESGHGFDNVTVGDLPPTLLDRYMSAAQKISRLAIGSTQTSMQADTIRLPADRTQETHVDGLPPGTRGGLSFQYTFAKDGEYEIQVWLMRDLASTVAGVREKERSHELIVLIDREPVKTFTIQKLIEEDTTLDKDLVARVTVSAGPHEIGVTFVNSRSSILESGKQPRLSRFNERREQRTAPAVDQVSVIGPYVAKGVHDTPARRRIFVCRPESGDREKETECAKTIVSTLMRRAYRRPVSNAEVEGPLALYREARAAGDFEAGIGHALSAVLISPGFLFRVEADPQKPIAGDAYRITDLELASRLSFFLWSSIPDDELLDVAIHGKLSRPAELEKQTRRMLADPRSVNLATNFAGQWLRLRNLNAFEPSTRIFPDFDDNVREGFRRETELFFDSVVREDRGVLDLIRADYTFLNERLAKFYGIPNVYGSHFRRVTVGPESNRGGLLRQGSVLSVTSYATRTSPIIRGVYVLSNIFGAPPPPPLPNVPALDDGTVSASLPMRERLAAHRKNAVCASCHRTIDPVGFALENFNAVGQWRNYEGDDPTPIDASGALPGSGEFRGVTELENALLARPEMFAGTLTEKLLTFALGRGVEYYDAPAVRKIVREAGKERYRFSSLIVGIVKSAPFQMRKTTS